MFHIKTCRWLDGVGSDRSTNWVTTIARDAFLKSSFSFRAFSFCQTARIVSEQHCSATKSWLIWKNDPSMTLVDNFIKIWFTKNDWKIKISYLKLVEILKSDSISKINKSLFVQKIRFFKHQRDGWMTFQILKQENLIHTKSPQDSLLMD